MAQNLKSVIPQNGEDHTYRQGRNLNDIQIIDHVILYMYYMTCKMITNNLYVCMNIIMELNDKEWKIKAS